MTIINHRMQMNHIMTYELMSRYARLATRANMCPVVGLVRSSGRGSLLPVIGVFPIVGLLSLPKLILIEPAHMLPPSRQHPIKQSVGCRAVAMLLEERRSSPTEREARQGKKRRRNAQQTELWMYARYVNEERLTHQPLFFADWFAACSESRSCHLVDGLAEVRSTVPVILPSR